MGERYGAPGLAASGVVVVVQDVRGTSSSGGCYPGLSGSGEDGYDCVEWVAAQPWCTGRVGMFGPSAMGATQWSAAEQAPPHLVAIAPEVIALDESRRSALRHETQLLFALAMARNRLVHDRDLWDPERYAERLAALDEALADPRAVLWRLPVTDQPLLDGLVSYYAERAAEGPSLGVGAIAYESVRVPAFIIGGWYDFTLSGCLNQYRGMRARAGTVQAREGSRLVVGPYYHGSAPCPLPDGWLDLAGGADDRTRDTQPLWSAWMAPYLAGGDGPSDPRPQPIRRARIFTMGVGAWRDVEDFSDPDATVARWYLASGGAANGWDGDGTLVAGPTPAPAPADRFDYDPLDPFPSPGGGSGGVFDLRPLLDRADVLVYRSDPLPEAVEASGPVSVALSVATSALDTDFTAALVDIRADGVAAAVADNLLRLRYRDGTEGVLAEPGRTYRVVVDLIAVSATFDIGHRIGVVLSSSNFPLWDRNPNTGDPLHSSARTVVAHQEVFHDADRPSYLALTVSAQGGEVGR